MIKKFIALVLCCTCLIISQTGCAEKEEIIQKTSYYMDTICTISIYGMEQMSQERAEDAIDAAFGVCADYEALISATREGSDIYRINRSQGAPVTCDPRTVDVLRLALVYGDRSGGAFDVTVGRLTDLWDFHAEDPQIPTKADVSEALQTVNYKQVHIQGNEVWLNNPQARLNLGGIGKGYVGDRAAECLQEQGVSSAVIDFGGNIITIGGKGSGEETGNGQSTSAQMQDDPTEDGQDANVQTQDDQDANAQVQDDQDANDQPGGKPFQIGIQKPFASGEYAGVVDVRDAVVITSGIYERGFEKDGHYYHHILDVKTGWPVDNDVVSVTLVGGIGHSADCDAMATICLMLGTEDGLAFVENVDGVEALFIDPDGEMRMTSGMAAYLE